MSGIPEIRMKQASRNPHAHHGLIAPAVESLGRARNRIKEEFLLK